MDWKVRTENDNNNQISIKNQWICSLAKVIIEGLEVEIIEKIKIAKNKNKEVVRIVEKIKKVGVKVLRGKEWQIEGDCYNLSSELRLYLGKDLRREKENIQVVKHKDTG